MDTYRLLNFFCFEAPTFRNKVAIGKRISYRLVEFVMQRLGKHLTDPTQPSLICALLMPEYSYRLSSEFLISDDIVSEVLSMLVNCLFIYLCFCLAIVFLLAFKLGLLTWRMWRKFNRSFHPLFLGLVCFKILTITMLTIRYDDKVISYYLWVSR